MSPNAVKRCSYQSSGFNYGAQSERGLVLIIGADGVGGWGEGGEFRLQTLYVTGPLKSHAENPSLFVF